MLCKEASDVQLVAKSEMISMTNICLKCFISPNLARNKLDERIYRSERTPALLRCPKSIQSFEAIPPIMSIENFDGCSKTFMDTCCLAMSVESSED